MDNFKILMLGAMYENGGNTTHRFLDSHPQMYVYPFESQLGTKYVEDYLKSIFPVKYRWPVFPLEATPSQDYKAFIDEEAKVRSRTPNVSKFRHIPFEFSDDERCTFYQSLIQKSGRSRAANVAAFFQATFQAWKDFRRTGKEEFYVGYSPALVVDADKVLQDFPQGHFLHIVRNPWSAYADTKKRPVPLSLEHYLLAWNINQYHALYFEKLFPGRMHILRAEDVMESPRKTLGAFCSKLGLQDSDTLDVPTWNGNPLQEVYPWGTIRTPTPKANHSTAMELSTKEQEQIRFLSADYLERFDYKNFL